MKKLVFTATFLAMVAAPALAAEAPNWTGFYAGVHSGAARQSTTQSFVDPNGVITPVGDRGHVTGAVGGIQLGYNWQFHPHLVAGIEGDFSGSMAERLYETHRMSFGAALIPNATYRSSTRLEWLSSIRPKLGVVGWRKLMFFATGGVAWAKISRFASETNAPPTFATYFDSRTSIDTILSGWVVGGGVETQATDHILLRLEYLGYSISSASAWANLRPNPGAFPAAFNYSWSRDSIAVLRAAASYKF